MGGPPPVQFDPMLLSRAARGDAEAWRRLVEAWSPRVFGLILRQCGDRDLAEEITQATFVKLVTQLGDGGYQEQGRFESWLFRVAVNQLRDEMRRRKRQAKTISTTADDDVPGHSGGGGGWNAVESDLASRRDPAENNPLEQLERREQVALLRQAVEQLNEADRAILHLRHTAGLSFPQIAETLGQPLGTVLARGHRALAKLRQLLDARNVA